jgi:hypothetical protein
MAGLGFLGFWDCWICSWAAADLPAFVGLRQVNQHRALRYKSGCAPATALRAFHCDPFRMAPTY